MKKQHVMCLLALWRRLADSAFKTTNDNLCLSSEERRGAFFPRHHARASVIKTLSLALQIFFAEKQKTAFVCSGLIRGTVEQVWLARFSR